MSNRLSLEYPVMALNDMPCHVLTQCLMVTNRPPAAQVSETSDSCV